MSAARAPGPGLLALPGVALAMRRDPLAGLTRLVETYGPIVRLSFGGAPFILVSRPEDVQRVLTDNQRAYQKSRYFNVERLAALGVSILTANGETWRRKRRITQHAFSRKALSGYVGAIVDATDRMLARWDGAGARGPDAARARVDIFKALVGLAIDVASRVFLGADLEGDRQTVAEAVTPIVEHAAARMSSIVKPPLWAPTPGNLRFRRALRSLDEVVYRVIAARRAEGTRGRTDAISTLLEAPDEETGERMDDRQIRNEFVTLLIAGHESTATALSWTLYLLAQHPEAEARAIREVEEALPDGRAPGPDDIDRLPFLRMAIEESMRLYPPSWLFDREAIEDDEVGGCRIPKGATILLCPYLNHRSPALWDEPERFRPERFAPGAAEGRPFFAYFPFGGGPRTCLGNRFAVMESQVVIARLLQRVRLRVVPDHPIETAPLISLRPRHGIAMTVEEPAGRRAREEDAPC